MILLLDNFDSFTYNIYQMVGEFHPDLEVYRNNVLTLADIETMNPSHIILSPGPGYPADAGIMSAVIRYFPVESPCSVFASATRESAKPSAPGSSTPLSPFTANAPPSSSTAAA